jgi:DNA-binding NarL/FixJ family response regulator
MKVLVLAEAASLRRLIRHIVSGVTDKIWECESSESLPAQYASIKPDFVLVDIDTPDVKRMSTLTTVRNIFQDARVIAITSYDHIDLRESMHRAGADACLAKDNLLQLVRLLRWPGPKF